MFNIDFCGRFVPRRIDSQARRFSTFRIIDSHPDGMDRRRILQTDSPPTKRIRREAVDKVILLIFQSCFSFPDSNLLRESHNNVRSQHTNLQPGFSDEPPLKLPFPLLFFSYTYPKARRLGKLVEKSDRSISRSDGGRCIPSKRGKRQVALDQRKKRNVGSGAASGERRSIRTRTEREDMERR